MISEDHLVKKSFDFMDWSSRMVSHYPSKFDGQKYCGSGDVTFSVVDKQDST